MRVQPRLGDENPLSASVFSERSKRKAARLVEIDLASVPRVALLAAQRREESQSGRAPGEMPQAQDWFEVREANWRVVSVEKLAAAERPDPAFRRLYPVDCGLFMIDDLGKAQGLGPIQAAALRYDRQGRLTAKAGFAHGVYRLGVHPRGRGLITMSPDCVLHAYNQDLQPLLETGLADSPEIRALRGRFDIMDAYLRNHIRCVAFSQDNRRYLFTAVDEAWCVDIGGDAIWGVKLPLQEGWERVSTAGATGGAGSQLQRALGLMNLSLPLTPEEFRRRYRELAMKWHPDRNSGNPEAQERMKALNSAAELLSAVDAGPDPDRRASLVRERGGTEFAAGGFKFRCFTTVSELYACDWIYAASFGVHSNSVYLAGYSGRVVLVNQEGQALRVYDLDDVPRRIVDTGEYLYLLTRSRLYVLRDDTVYARIDRLDGGDLLLAKSGFGLLEKNCLRWFDPQGALLGSILSKDPIRRVYCAADVMVMETRQRRAVIGGAPAWWA